MIMFLSSFYGIIDTKNRVAIPSSFRSTIKNSNEKSLYDELVKTKNKYNKLRTKYNKLVIKLMED